MLLRRATIAQLFLLLTGARSLGAGKIMKMSDRGVANVFLRLHHAEFGKVAANRVDQLGAVADQQVAHTVQHQGRLLRLPHDRNEAL